MSNLEKVITDHKFSSIIFGLYVVLSAIKLSIIPLEQLKGLGDITHFYNLAQIPGLPFVNYWAEFPPLSAYLFELFYWLSKENYHWFTILFLLFITIVNFGNLVFFDKVLTCFPNLSAQNKRNLLFFFLLVMVFLPYTWWYFDGLTLLLLLIGFYYFIKARLHRSAIFIAAGILTKLFPVLFLVVYLKKKIPLSKTMFVLFLTIGITIVPYLILFYLSPEMTKASIISQATKGSWETMWALIDGNYQTGNFGPLWERLDPATAYTQLGNAAIIDQKFTLFLFGVLGLLGIWKKNIKTPHQFAQLVLFTLCLFFLWSAGWSPQWVLYLIPFLLFSIISSKKSILISLIFILINLIEWPIVIGLQLLNLLPVTVILRTIGFLILAIYLYGLMGQESKYPV